MVLNVNEVSQLLISLRMAEMPKNKSNNGWPQSTGGWKSGDFI